MYQKIKKKTFVANLYIKSTFLCVSYSKNERQKSDPELPF